MGMEFALVVSPDEIGTPSESAGLCGQQSLEAGSAENVDDSSAAMTKKFVLAGLAALISGFVATMLT